jgi:hypothetical protein
MIAMGPWHACIPLVLGLYSNSDEQIIQVKIVDRTKMINFSTQSTDQA